MSSSAISTSTWGSSYCCAGYTFLFLPSTATGGTRYPVQLPGFGPIVTMTALAAIGDITRSPSAGHLVGYAGLGASVDASGKTHRTGRITKQVGRNAAQLCRVAHIREGLNKPDRRKNRPPTRIVPRVGVGC
jgi:hypothetical protein